MSELDDFRADKDAFFRDDPRSPLTDEQRVGFIGLSYFPEAADLEIEGVLETDGVDLDEPIVMQTSTGGEQTYHRAGVVRFEVGGQPAQVTLYSSPDMHELFLPFRDGTSGKDTYGAGRYLEVERPVAESHVMIDFNVAYNPYCAYNPNWSCPIPPGENWLAVPIRAGERTFHSAG
jgi:uncharacterized protein (DUF1684 family)